MSFASQLFLLSSLELGPIPTIINLEPATITADNKAITCNPPNATDETVVIPDMKTSHYVILSTVVWSLALQYSRFTSCTSTNDTCFAELANHLHSGRVNAVRHASVGVVANHYPTLISLPFDSHSQ